MPVPWLRATGPNHVWNWEISYLPTSLKGIWLHLYLVIDVWSRKVLAWDVEECEDAKLAADLVSRACLKEQISRRRKQPLILHADNGNAQAAGFRASIAGDDAGGATGRAGCAQILLTPAGEQRKYLLGIVVPHGKYLSDYPNWLFSSKEEACIWVASFVDWYNHQHRHSGIKFVTTQ
jgi:transposase InsO family protein